MYKLTCPRQLRQLPGREAGTIERVLAAIFEGRSDHAAVSSSGSEESSQSTDLSNRLSSEHPSPQEDNRESPVGGPFVSLNPPERQVIVNSFWDGGFVASGLWIGGETDHK